jgi:hypothetical protein
MDTNKSSPNDLHLSSSPSGTIPKIKKRKEKRIHADADADAGSLRGTLRFLSRRFVSRIID